MKDIRTVTDRLLAWVKKYKFHLWGWSIFIAYESLAAFKATGITGHVFSYILHYTINISLFYFHAHLIFPAALKKPTDRFWLVPLLITFEVVLYLTIGLAGDWILAKFTDALTITEVRFDNRFFWGGLWRGVYFIGFSSGYYFLRKYFKEQKTTALLKQQALEQTIREQQTALELAEAKNAFLRAQINPHLLFNTLNFLYNQVRKNNDTAARAILLLSEIMTYAMGQDEHSGTRPLEGEIEQANNLIELWRLKQREPTYIDLIAEDGTKEISFIPLALVTLVENMLKHGDLSKADHPATLRISLKDDIFRIETDNLAAPRPSHAGFHSGLENIRQRLAYKFHKMATLDYGTTSANHFFVRIELRLPIFNKLMYSTPKD